MQGEIPRGADIQGSCTRAVLPLQAKGWKGNPKDTAVRAGSLPPHHRAPGEPGTTPSPLRPLPMIPGACGHAAGPLGIGEATRRAQPMPDFFLKLPTLTQSDLPSWPEKSSKCGTSAFPEIGALVAQSQENPMWDSRSGAGLGALSQHSINSPINLSIPEARSSSSSGTSAIRGSLQAPAGAVAAGKASRRRGLRGHWPSWLFCGGPLCPASEPVMFQPNAPRRALSPHAAEHTFVVNTILFRLRWNPWEPEARWGHG